MGTADWRTGESLDRRLRTRPAGFEFFQWVRLASWPPRDPVHRSDTVEQASLTVERSLGHELKAQGARRVGSQVRFRGELSSAFPGSEISHGRLLAERNGAATATRLELFVSNFSLLGVLGPMPDSFAEWVRERLGERDSGMAEFLDIFNHRISTLRYELKAASALGFDALRPERTAYAAAAGALMGLSAFEGEGDAILRQGMPMPRRALLALAGVVGNGRKSIATAATVLRVYLGTPLRIDQMVGDWKAIEPRDRTRLGRRRLVDVAPLGRRVWVPHAGIALALGPVSYARLCQWLPDRQAGASGDGLPPFGNGHAGLCAMLRYLFDRRVDVHVTVRVDPRDVPSAVLSLPRRPVGGAGYGARLGQTAWLRGSGRAPREVRFTVHAGASGVAA
ncbi:type VI secretion system baseplate subunit TssG [Xanthomonas sp. NCPPB 2632]|uniref:type VI secretion system baseplate subunit TssG n=1 Tax=Xanthomonas sp. NCPPB 2632 TaxID=3240912 RepID=UPI0035144377